MTTRGVGAVAEVVVDLALERGLDHPLGELGDQATLVGQCQPALAGLAGQAGDQLPVDGVEHVRTQRRQRDVPASSELVEVNHWLGHQISHSHGRPTRGNDH